MKRLTSILIAIFLTATVSAQVFTPVAFDKKYHIGAGVIVGVWGTFAGNSMDYTPEGSALFGIAAVTVAGIGKELMDVAPRVFGHKEAQFDFNDVAATTLGGVVGVGLTYLGLKAYNFFGYHPFKPASGLRLDTYLADNNFQIGININF